MKLTFLFFLSTSGLFGQSWFPDAAVWHYSYNSFFGEQGYVRMEVGADTLISGGPARRLIKTRVASWLWDEPTTQTLGNVFVRETGGLVLIYDPSISGFDTLYNMSASIGDQWLLPALPAPACDPESYMLVTDTGTMVIDDHPLRWLAVETIYYVGSLTPIFTVPDTIVERIGTLSSYQLPMDQCMAMLDWHEGGPFKCYSDNQISYNINEEIPCDMNTAINVLLSDDVLFFRQIDRTIQIDLQDERTAQLQLFDIQGRMLSSGTITNGAVIDLSDLSSAIVLFRLIFPDGQVHSRKILLE